MARDLNRATPAKKLRGGFIRALAATGPLLLACFALTACRENDGAGREAGASSTNPSAPAPSGERRRILCTVGMVTDIVRQVVGDRHEVVGMIGTGVDPHLYKPSRNDIAALQNANLVFFNGLMLEGKMSDALVRVANANRMVIPVTEKLDERYLLEPPEFAGHVDPHVWMDVAAWSQAVGVVASAMAKFDPPNEAFYEANAKRYQAELAALDAYAKQAIASVPRERRVLITAHDAFNYFGRAYDIEVRGIQGISTESDPGLKDINDLVDLIVARGVKAVFVESSVAEKNVRALIEGAKSRGHDVAVGGTLFSDAMGRPETYEGTYIGMLDHNATTIARALGGDAPERGMQGKLAAR